MQLNPTTKKILYTVLLLAVTLSVGYLLYVIFIYQPQQNANGNQNSGRNIGLPNVNGLLNFNGVTNTNGTNANVPTNTNGGSGLPVIDPVASGGNTATTILTPDTEVQDPAPSTDGSMRYYDPNDGKFYHVNENGDISTLSDAQFRGAEKVDWANNSNEVILEFPDKSKVYYNIDTKRQVTLPKEFEEIKFSPTDSQIAFLYMHVDEERRVLAVSSPDGTSAKTLESLGQHADNVMVDWSPTGKVAATYSEFIDANRQTLGFIGLNGENLKGAVVEGRGIRSQYAPNGQQLLYSSYSADTGYKPGLWVVDADGDNIGKNRKQLDVNTFADKCTISSNSKTAYCGVPTQQIYGFGLDEDVLAGVPDEIYKIDLASGVKTKVAVPVNAAGKASYSIKNMMVTKDESTLVFRDSQTGRLVKLDLK